MAATGTTVPFTSLLQGGGASSKNFDQGPELRWYRSDTAWAKSLFSGWLPDGGFGGAKSPDFAKQDVLVFTLGDVGSGGHSITLVKIARNGKTVFQLKSTKPGQNVPTAAVMQNPFHMVSVDKGLPSANLEFLMNGKNTAFTAHIEE